MPKRNLDLTSTDACRDLARAVFFSYRTRARSFLYNVRWPLQFRKIDELAERAMKER